MGGSTPALDTHVAEDQEAWLWRAPTEDGVGWQEFGPARRLGLFAITLGLLSVLREVDLLSRVSFYCVTFALLAVLVWLYEFSQRPPETPLKEPVATEDA